MEYLKIKYFIDEDKRAYEKFVKIRLLNWKKFKYACSPIMNTNSSF